MSDYKEAVLTWRSWQRANVIHVGNGYGGVPWIKFFEEKLTELSDGQIIRANAGELLEEMTDPLTEFDLLNPLDGSVIGTATYQQLQVLLYSLYFHLVTLRDTPAEP